MARLQPTQRRALSRAGVRVFKNYSFLAASYGLSRLLTFFSLIYIARRLGVQTFGQVNFALAVFTYSTLLTHLGLMTFGTREVARRPDQIKGHVSAILSLRMLLTLVSFSLLLVFTFLVALDRQLKFLLLLFGLSLFPTAGLMDWAFKGVERMTVVGVIEMVRACSYLVLVLVWVQQPSQALRIPIFFFLSTLLAALYGWTLFRRDYGGLRPQVDLMFWKRALRESLPLGLAFMLLQVYYLTDTIVLGLLRGAVSVGLYSAAYKTAAFVLAVGGLFFETIFPVIARYHEHARERLPWLLNSVLRVTLLLSIPMAVGGTVLSRPILTGLYGREYGAATIAFRLLIWAVAIELLGLNWGYALMACDRTNGYLKAVGLGAGLSVILNVALVPKLGLMGAGLARLASSALISLGLCLQFRRVSRVHALRYFLKPLLASALMAAAMLLLGHSWILQLALGIVVYSGTILAIGPAERDYAMRFANAILSAPSHKARQSAGPDHEISGREPATRPATASDV